MQLHLPLLICASLLTVACGGRAKGHVYTALDEQFSRKVLEQFQQEIGSDLVLRFDTEAAKTVGLVSAIIEEQKSPRCSVFWNNELAHTVRLAQMGLLESYDSPSARDIPAPWRDKDHRWAAFAARARIIVVNTEVLPDPKDWPKSYIDLIDPKWKGRCAVAKPLTGTTLTHFTALQKVLGQPEVSDLLDQMVRNEVRFLQSNGATMRATADGSVAWAFTDTDDYHVAKSKGHPVACVFPDQQSGGIGTMLIPNSVAIIKGCPDLEAAKRLVDKILSRDTEALLAASRSAQIPLRDGVPGPKDTSILPPADIHVMEWDVEWTANNLARCSQEYGKRFGL
jgi:iron(III) transport system substrate-binding protein